MDLNINSGFSSVNFNARGPKKWWRQIARQTSVPKRDTGNLTQTTVKRTNSYKPAKYTKPAIATTASVPAIVSAKSYADTKSTDSSVVTNNINRNDNGVNNSQNIISAPDINTAKVDTKEQTHNISTKRADILNKSSLTMVDFVEYFRDSKLSKEIPEFIKEGERFIRNMQGSWILDEPRINSIKYCEKIADKILSDDTLKNNPSIRDNSFHIISVYASTNSGLKGQDFIEQSTAGRIKLLDAYSKNKKMQQNPVISSKIGDLVCSTYDDARADCIIKILNENIENKTPEFYKNLNTALDYGIPADVITIMFSNKKMREQYLNRDYTMRLSCMEKYLKEIEPKYIAQLLEIYQKKEYAAENFESIMNTYQKKLVCWKTPEEAIRRIKQDNFW